MSFCSLNGIFRIFPVSGVFVFRRSQRLIGWIWPYRCKRIFECICVLSGDFAIISVSANRRANRAMLYFAIARKEYVTAINRICTSKSHSYFILRCWKFNTIANIWRAKNIGVQIRMMAGDVFIAWVAGRIMQFSAWNAKIMATWHGA